MPREEKTNTFIPYTCYSGTEGRSVFIGRVSVSLGIEGSLVQDYTHAPCCVYPLIQSRRTGKRPDMAEKLLTGM